MKLSFGVAASLDTANGIVQASPAALISHVIVVKATPGDATRDSTVNVETAPMSSTKMPGSFQSGGPDRYARIDKWGNLEIVNLSPGTTGTGGGGGGPPLNPDIYLITTID